MNIEEIYNSDYDTKTIYKYLYYTEKELNINNFADNYFLELHKNIKEITEILKYFIYINNKDLLILTPKLNMLLLFLMTKYDEIENANFHTVLELLQKFKKLF
jgi:hypothetical protein